MIKKYTCTQCSRIFVKGEMFNDHMCLPCRNKAVQRVRESALAAELAADSKPNMSAAHAEFWFEQRAGTYAHRYMNTAPVEPLDPPETKGEPYDWGDGNKVVDDLDDHVVEPGVTHGDIPRYSIDTWAAMTTLQRVRALQGMSEYEAAQLVDSMERRGR